MAYKTLIFGTDDLFGKLQPFYMREVQRGNLEIVALAVIEPNGISFVTPDGELGEGDLLQFDLAIISSNNNFYQRMKFLEAHGVPRNQIIDGRVFQIPNLDFPRLVTEGIAYGTFEDNKFSTDFNHIVCPRFCQFKNNNLVISFGTQSYIGHNALIEGDGVLSIGKYTGISWNNTFEFGLNCTHDYKKVSSFSLRCLGWQAPADFWPKNNQCKILIGNDVWIGRGCFLKCTNPNKPLIIGDGAVIASDSVVVKNVPPYAIVGGNPAKIIKYRFEPHIIESLLRIKWWDWSLDKIHDNFKYFNDIEKFIALHDK